MCRACARVRRAFAGCCPRSLASGDSGSAGAGHHKPRCLGFGGEVGFQMLGRAREGGRRKGGPINGGRGRDGIGAADNHRRRGLPHPWTPSPPLDPNFIVRKPEIYKGKHLSLQSSRRCLFQPTATRPMVTPTVSSPRPLRHETEHCTGFESGAKGHAGSTVAEVH